MTTNTDERLRILQIRALLNAIESTDVKLRQHLYFKEIEALARKAKNDLKKAIVEEDDSG